MGGMKDLFGDTPYDEVQGEGEAFARNTDPDTSHAAAQKVKGKPAAHLQLVFLKALDGRADGLTLGQIETVTGIEWKTITPRAAPLKKMGAIEIRFNDDGRKIKRESPSTGHQQEVLFITDVGRRMLKQE